MEQTVWPEVYRGEAEDLLGESPWNSPAGESQGLLQLHARRQDVAKFISRCHWPTAIATTTLPHPSHWHTQALTLLSSPLDQFKTDSHTCYLRKMCSQISIPASSTDSQRKTEVSMVHLGMWQTGFPAWPCYWLALRTAASDLTCLLAVWGRN